MVSLALPIRVHSLFSEKLLRQSLQRERERERFYPVGTGVRSFLIEVQVFGPRKIHHVAFLSYEEDGLGSL